MLWSQCSEYLTDENSTLLIKLNAVIRQDDTSRNKYGEGVRKDKPSSVLCVLCVLTASDHSAHDRFLSNVWVFVSEHPPFRKIVCVHLTVSAGSPRLLRAQWRLQWRPVCEADNMAVWACNGCFLFCHIFSFVCYEKQVSFNCISIPGAKEACLKWQPHGRRGLLTIKGGFLRFSQKRWLSVMFSDGLSVCVIHLELHLAICWVFPGAWITARQFIKQSCTQVKSIVSAVIFLLLFYLSTT